MVQASHVSYQVHNCDVQTKMGNKKEKLNVHVLLNYIAEITRDLTTNFVYHKHLDFSIS